MPTRPWFDVIEPVVPFREYVTEPDHADRSQAQTLPVPMRGKMSVQQIGYLHAFQLRQQHWNIINSFYGQRFKFVHDVSVTSILLPV